jgi:UDP-N-acetyl-D-mannosaminuronic acid dehydrogenase
MLKGKELLIQIEEPIINALKVLNKTEKKVLICVNDEHKLLGVIADGDIRRALIKGVSIQDSLLHVMNPKPIFVTDQAHPDEAFRLLSKQSPVVPVVDPYNVVVGYYVYKERSDYVPIRERSITILGMGYVGLTLGLVLAEAGFRVKGFDTNDALISKLSRRKPAFYEEGIEDFLKERAENRLTFSYDIRESKSSIYIITVGTPLIKETNEPNIAHIKAALVAIGGTLEAGDLVILRSTVPIGCSRELVVPTLQDLSNMRCGSDFFLSFAPERTAEGAALKELRQNPQIIGAYDPISYEMTARLFHEITPSVIDVGSLEAAEMAKLLDNTFRDHLFAYSNFVAQLAERLGVDFHKIASAVNYGYERNMIPRPSPGVAGPCLSKDPYIMKKAFEKFDLDSSLIDATRKINESGPAMVKEKCERLLMKAGKRLENVKKIGLVGMAFKGNPETSDMRDSTSVMFLKQLPNLSSVVAFDPVVPRRDLEGLGVRTVAAEEVFDGSDLVVILNNHRSYAKWPIHTLLDKMNKPAVFIDTWRVFDPITLKRIPGIIYGGVGND